MGTRDHAEYSVWVDMRTRCANPKNSRYRRYGGRGISVCNRWNDFATFLDDIGSRPSPQHSIDRIDNDGNYEPGNCRWATRSQQQRNRGEYPKDHKLPRGDDHWTRRDRERAKVVSRANIMGAHRSGAENNNAKMTKVDIARLRRVYDSDPSIGLVDLGKQFGVGRETARKIVRGIAWT